jgi:hypothetical protein
MPLAGAKGESRRLALEEDDWNLLVGSSTGAPLTRTRGGGRPVVEEVVVVDEEQESATATVADEEESTEPDESMEEEEETPTAVARRRKSKKPPHSRVILQVSQLEQAFQHYPCPECEEYLELKLRTVCIATTIELICNNKDCSYVCNFDEPTKTTMHEDDPHHYERMTDYAINVLYVLGFISVGDAHTEAGRMLGLLGLPNDTTMMNRSFSIIEDRIGPYLRELCADILSENMNEEARLSMNEIDYNIWKMWSADPTLGPLPTERMPQIDASYDMAWQQKGSGHVYNSQSGHGTLFGRHSRKIIGLVIKSKLCCYCNTFTRKHPDTEVPLHLCWKNHVGSSGSMESSGAVQVLVDAFEQKKVVIKRLCCDDDSSIRADCQWSNADYLNNNNTTVLPTVKKIHGKNKGELQPKPDKGKLPGTVPEPLFVADPNHRRKGLTGDLIGLDKSKKDVKATMTRMDSTRIGKNFGYMARTLKDKQESEYEDAAKACLEHHFDCHDFCGTWCKRKTATEEQLLASVKYYRCKEKDAKLYALLSEKMARFVTKDRLVEMAHSLDTNMNEAFNQICTWFAPKNKVFAGSGSLHNRIAFAVGINSLGVEVFFKRLFKMMGIAITENVAYYLHSKEQTRSKRLAKIRTKEAKVKKNKRKYDKLKDLTADAVKRFDKRQREAGTYKSNTNMDDPHGELEKKKKTPPAKKFCGFCGKKGHVTKRAKACTAPADVIVEIYRTDDGSLLSEAPRAPADTEASIQGLAAAAMAAMAEQDCDLMDSLPFDADYDSEDDQVELALAMLGEDDDDSDDDSVRLVGGTI